MTSKTEFVLSHSVRVSNCRVLAGGLWLRVPGEPWLRYRLGLHRLKARLWLASRSSRGYERKASVPYFVDLSVGPWCPQDGLPACPERAMQEKARGSHDTFTASPTRSLPPYLSLDRSPYVRFALKVSPFRGKSVEEFVGVF